MTEFVCNYSLLRFLPYRDTGEFVNIGVALACGATGFLGFRVENQRYARVSHFFPELEITTYRAGLRALNAEFNRWRMSVLRLSEKKSEQQETILRHVFGELIRPREGIFQFGTPRTLLVSNPAHALDEIFERDVRRRFWVQSSQEETLRHQVAESLRAFELKQFYKQACVGTEDYHVTLPFVAVSQTTQSHIENEDLAGEEETDLLLQSPRKAIKPLDLKRTEPTDVTQHGDEWLARVRRLKEFHHQPREWLFVIREPENARARRAASAIRLDLEKLDVFTVKDNETNALIQFATLDSA